MMITYILDENHNPIQEPDAIKWGTWIKNKDNKIVKQENIGQIWVSTVFLGINHNFTFNPHKNPVLFETMLFDKGFPIEEEYQERCETYEQALKMHEAGVLEAKRLQGFNMTLQQLETELLALQHHPKCLVHKDHHLCECGLSRGRSDLLDYIESMKLLNAKTN